MGNILKFEWTHTRNIHEKVELNYEIRERTNPYIKIGGLHFWKVNDNYADDHGIGSWGSFIPSHL